MFARAAEKKYHKLQKFFIISQFWGRGVPNQGWVGLDLSETVKEGSVLGLIAWLADGYPLFVSLPVAFSLCVRMLVLLD